MKNKTPPQSELPNPRQQTFNFSDPKHWKQLPQPDREACQYSLSLLLLQIVSNTKENNQNNHIDER